MRVVRSPHARARFSLGDMAALYEKYPGLVDVLTERDVPGSNASASIPRARISRSLRPGWRGIGAKPSLRWWATKDDRLDP